MLWLIILPLTQPTKEKKQKLVEDAVAIARKIADESRQIFGIAGICVASNKFIDKEYFNRLKEWLKMTHLARLYEEEKIEAVNISHRAGLQQGQAQIARNMLISGMDVLQIMQLTGLTRIELDEVKQSISESELAGGLVSRS